MIGPMNSMGSESNQTLLGRVAEFMVRKSSPHGPVYPMGIQLIALAPCVSMSIMESWRSRGQFSLTAQKSGGCSSHASDHPSNSDGCDSPFSFSSSSFTTGSHHPALPLQVVEVLPPSCSPPSVLSCHLQPLAALPPGSQGSSAGSMRIRHRACSDYRHILLTSCKKPW